MIDKPVVILTGCSGELGRTFIAEYGNDYRILAIGRNEPPKVSGQFRFFQAHLPDDAELIVSAALELYGTIDCIINNAVVYDLKSITETTSEEFTHQLAVNVAGPLALANEGLKQCWQTRPEQENREQQRAVINISSVSGVTAFLGFSQAAYSSSKSALNMLTRHMAAEYQPYGVKVNSLAPGSFPRSITTESVCQKVVELWHSDSSGEILLFDASQCKPLERNEQQR